MLIIIEIYEIFCTAVMTVIFLSILIGIEVKVESFKYSIKNILEKRMKNKKK